MTAREELAETWAQEGTELIVGQVVFSITGHPKVANVVCLGCGKTDEEALRVARNHAEKRLAELADELYNTRPRRRSRGKK
jgi:Fe2+ or Zn2+ uptake regulation protein